MPAGFVAGALENFCLPGILLGTMNDLFRLRHSDQRTLALVLAILTGLLCFSMTKNRDTLESKQYRFRIDMNTATPGELQTLPGIGPVLAGAIIHYRDQHVPMEDFNEILNVKGIGVKRHGAIKQYFMD